MKLTLISACCGKGYAELVKFQNILNKYKIPAIIEKLDYMPQISLVKKYELTKESIKADPPIIIDELGILIRASDVQDKTNINILIETIIKKKPELITKGIQEV